MSYEIHAVSRLRFFAETMASAFADDATSSPGLGSFVDIPASEGSAQMVLTTDSIDPQNNVQNIFQYREEVVGKRSASLTFSLPLAATGTAAAAAVAAVQGPVGALLKVAMGGEKLGTGTTFTGGTATVPTVTSAAGFEAGAAIGWSNTSGVVEWREIESISGSSVTLKHAFSGSPSAAQVAYACATYYLQAITQSAQFLVEGSESDDRWLLLGGGLESVAIAIDVTGAALPALTFTWKFASFLKSNETAASVTGTLGTASYTNYSPIAGHVGELRLFTVADSVLTSASIVHASAITFAPKISATPVTSPSGEQTVLQWVSARNAPAIEGSVTFPYESLAWWTAQATRTDHDVVYTIGTTAGAGVVLAAPTVQIIAPQRQADAGGIAAQMITWKGRQDTDVGSSTTAIALSPFRVHIT